MCGSEGLAKAAECPMETPNELPSSPALPPTAQYLLDDERHIFDQLPLPVADVK